LNKLALKIAWRYLVAKKSTNAINIITGIAVFGLSMGVAVLILVLSVFNGFEQLLTNMVSNFAPDIKVEAVKGKTFISDSSLVYKIRALPQVKSVSETLEEIAFFECNKSQNFGTIKGVDTFFAQTNRVPSAIKEGKYIISSDQKDYAVMGRGVSNQLSVYLKDEFNQLAVYMPKRAEVSALEAPFKKQYLTPSGIFEIQQEIDNQYVITNLDFVRQLLQSDGNEVSAFEIKLKEGSEVTGFSKSLQKIVGAQFTVKTRLQQDDAFMKLVNVEKWMTFAILSFTILLIAFNVVGALWMIVLEKQKDLSIMSSMGARKSLLERIFLSEGFWICTLSVLIGFFLAISIYKIHTTLQGGLVPLPPGFAIDRYPVELRAFDFLYVAVIVYLIGMAASIPAMLRAGKTNLSIK